MGSGVGGDSPPGPPFQQRDLESAVISPCSVRGRAPATKWFLTVFLGLPVAYYGRAEVPQYGSKWGYINSCRARNCISMALVNCSNFPTLLSTHTLM